MIGIYGGTFNPVHYGHLRTALEMQEAFGLDEIRLIPCYQPALKDRPQVSAKMRRKMLELAIEGQPGFVCDSRELEREGPSYMVDTLASLRDDFPQQSLALFIGTDAFACIKRWHRWQVLFDYAHIVVMTRPDAEVMPLDDFFKSRFQADTTALKNRLSGSLCFRSVTQLAISSTKIRSLVENQRCVRFLLPDNVIDYMARNNLYRNLNADR